MGHGSSYFLDVVSPEGVMGLLPTEKESLWCITAPGALRAGRLEFPEDESRNSE